MSGISVGIPDGKMKTRQLISEENIVRQVKAAEIARRKRPPSRQHGQKKQDRQRSQEQEHRCITLPEGGHQVISKEARNAA
jgi:hypothetical protein